MSNLTRPYLITPNSGHTSQEFNRALQDLFADWQAVHETATELGLDIDRLYKRLALQTAAYTSAFSLLLFAAKDPTLFYQDAHYLAEGVVVEEDTTAHYWPEYGVYTQQFSIPTPANQFTVKDATDQLWLPSATILRYGIGPEDDDTEPTSYLMATREDAYPAFDGQDHTAWFVDLADDEEYVWVKADLPLEYLFSAATNVIAIRPQPEFSAKLVGFWYNVAGDWSTNQVDSERNALPELFFLPPTRIQSVRFQYRIPTDLSGPRGFYLVHLGCHYLDWQPATLSLDFRDALPADTQLAVSADNTVNPGVTEDEKPAISLVQRGTLNNNGASIALAAKTTNLPQVVNTLKFRLTASVKSLPEIGAPHVHSTQPSLCDRYARHRPRRRRRAFGKSAGRRLV